ncbi:hypothetical protein IWW55_000303 [Coemansia sp. RSA 2706]|nr:hypothetical protein IWW55_000303 [Coemansia sp. RSA 2706]
MGIVTAYYYRPIDETEFPYEHDIGERQLSVGDIKVEIYLILREDLDMYIENIPAEDTDMFARARTLEGMRITVEYNEQVLPDNAVIKGLPGDDWIVVG